MSWEIERDGTRNFCFVSEEELVIGHGSGHSESAGACSLQSFLDGEYQDLVRQTFGEEVLASALAEARGHLTEKRRRQWLPLLERVLRESFPGRGERIASALATERCLHGDGTEMTWEQALSDLRRAVQHALPDAQEEIVAWARKRLDRRCADDLATRLRGEYGSLPPCVSHVLSTMMQVATVTDAAGALGSASRDREIARSVVSWTVVDALPRWLEAAGREFHAPARDLRSLDPRISVGLRAARRRLQGFVGRLENRTRRPFPSGASIVGTIAADAAGLTPGEGRAALHLANVLRLSAEAAAARPGSRARDTEAAVLTSLADLTKVALTRSTSR